MASSSSVNETFLTQSDFEASGVLPLAVRVLALVVVLVVAVEPPVVVGILVLVLCPPEEAVVHIAKH